ncbi:MAG: hypothetical protein KAI53_05625 [Candidatus Aenigmarchaeota archaeon]|nr:hypothetical protein [Candidatus Aenigmarchaeota archaeon]
MIPENQSIVVPYSAGKTQEIYANMLKEIAGRNKDNLSMAFEENGSSITASCDWFRWFLPALKGGASNAKLKNNQAMPAFHLQLLKLRPLGRS